MLKKDRRLTRKAFNNTYDTGKNISADIGYFKVAPHDGPSQFACVSAKSDVKTSVNRTRIRRRGYAALADNFPVPDGWRVIWFLPAAARDCDFSKLRKTARDLIEQLI